MIYMDITFNRKISSCALTACYCLLAAFPARAGWLLWEAPPPPVAAPAGEIYAASPQTILAELLPVEACDQQGRDCANAGTVFEGGETALRDFIAAAGFETADRSAKNVFFAWVKGFYTGRPGTGPRLAPGRLYRGRTQDLSFASGNGYRAYAWRLPYRTAAGPLWLAALQPFCPVAWDNALKTQKKARAVKARTSSQEFRLIRLP